ncbi:MAG: hypothetical protein WCE96_08425 [Nitrososphaeraceae archaeon]
MNISQSTISLGQNFPYRLNIFGSTNDYSKLSSLVLWYTIPALGNAFLMAISYNGVCIFAT